MSRALKLLPLALATVLGVSACTLGTESVSSTSSSATLSSRSSDVATSSSSTPSSSSTSASSTSTPHPQVSAQELSSLADSKTVRACTIGDLSFLLGGGQFCQKDSGTITAGYPGQTVYFTTAIKYRSTAKYTYTASVAGTSRPGNLTTTASVPDGQVVTLSVRVPVESSGTYEVRFDEDGKQLGKRTVKVAMP